jgi:hypothetical protein
MLLKELKELIPDMIKARGKKKQLDKQEEKALTEIHKALLDNNQVLQEAITLAVIREMGYLFQAQEMQEEERYKRLDCLIRQQQSYRKEMAHGSPLKQLRRIFEG